MFTTLLYLVLLFYFVNAVGEKSTKMCAEYAKAVYQEEMSPVLLPTAHRNNISQCGILEVPLIVGGVTTGDMEFPHMALLGYGPDSKIRWLCGGALISDFYVLTAAHCIRSPDKGPAKFARFGDRSLDDSDELAMKQLIRIADRIKHPLYHSPSAYNDIGLLRLLKRVTFDGHVRPACLHIESKIPWTKAIAIGFGKTTFTSGSINNELLKVHLPIIPNEKCSIAFKGQIGSPHLPHGIVDTMLCVGELAGGKDTCQGDSGGPLQQVLENPFCMYSIFGITSFGKFCGYRNSPAVYTKVSAYIQWIEQIVWP